jgi:hypothetical protein
MNPPARIQIELLSDTTFTRGEGTAGEVDVEVDHDALGLPVVPGKALHGLLRDAWLTMARHFSDLAGPARQVLGVEGDLTETSLLRVGDAVLPPDVREWVRYAVSRRDDPLTPGQVLRTLTAVRRQTAQDRLTGAADLTTLRSSRVVLRGLRLASPLTWLTPPGPEHLQVLALCALGVRHGGLARSRGRGHLLVTLDGNEEATRKMAKGERAKSPPAEAGTPTAEPIVGVPASPGPAQEPAEVGTPTAEATT